MNYKDKKVLVFGLGLLGGGVATANWFIEQGALVTITDSKDASYLAPSLRRLRGNYNLSLGHYEEDDIRNSDIVVFNPAVPIDSQPVRAAYRLHKQVENEATIFYALCNKPITAVTGTRGKTTTVNWLRHLLGRQAIIAGNSYKNPLLKTLPKINKRKRAVVVNEIPSYHLEYFSKTTRPPRVAVITNLYEDHLNRHHTMEGYADAKAGIFMSQSSSDDLILNADNEWTPYFLSKNPKSRVWYFSLQKLAVSQNGLYWRQGKVMLQENGRGTLITKLPTFQKKWGSHNVANLLAAMLAAWRTGEGWQNICSRIQTLPDVEFRQQIIYSSPSLRVINDTTAISPEGSSAAIRRFGGKGCVLIAGGTDCEFHYGEWVKDVVKKIRPANLFLLSGSATRSIKKLLPPKYADTPVFDSYRECFTAALRRARNMKPATLLLSPGAKSFGIFKNEYDRGRKFNAFIKNYLRQKNN